MIFAYDKFNDGIPVPNLADRHNHYQWRDIAEIDSLPFARSFDVDKYDDVYYLIEPWHNNSNFGPQPDAHSPLNDIDEYILDLCHSNKLTIIYSLPECILYPDDTARQLLLAIDQLGLNLNQFKVITSNRYLKIKYGFLYYPYFEQAYGSILRLNNTETVQQVNINRRPKKFTCLNRNDKHHRRIISAVFQKHDIFDQGYYSYHMRSFKDSKGDRHNKRDKMFNDFNGNALVPYMIEAEKRFPMVVEEEDIGLINKHEINPTFLYTDAYWHIIAETTVDSNFLSEKTFKPIANLQPFIIVAGHYSLKELHELGYKTFGDFIDESYDNIEDDWCRAEATAELAVSIINKPHEWHIDIMTKLIPILEHNRNHFLNTTHRFIDILGK